MGGIVKRIRAKVTRANQHIHDFQLALAAFYKTKPYRVAIEIDRDAGKRLYRIEHIGDLPGELTHIAADIIQNLRSPLDQIAYQLVIAAGGPPSKKIYYPIRDLAAHYPSARGPIAKHVRKEVIDAIDTTEPYKGGKGHALWQLNKLHTSDEHQVPLALASTNYGIDVAADMRPLMANFRRRAEAITGRKGPDFPPVIFRAANPTPAHVGDTIMSESIEAEVDYKRQFPFEVALHEPGVIECKPALKTLKDMANLVDGIVATLGRFLP